MESELVNYKVQNRELREENKKLKEKLTDVVEKMHDMRQELKSKELLISDVM